MQAMSAVAAALLRCSVSGGIYGAVCSVIYVGLSSIAEAIGAKEPLGALAVFLISIPYGIMFGFPAGFIAGAIGGSLGGPLGWGIGGAIGPMASCALLLRNVTLLQALQVATLPSVMGAAVGCVLGWDLRHQPPTVMGAQWIAECVYRSPLGGWAGWRRRWTTHGIAR